MEADHSRVDNWKFLGIEAQNKKSWYSLPVEALAQGFWNFEVEMQVIKN